MAKIIMVGDAMVVQSAHTVAEIETLEKYAPSSLILKDSEGNEVFRVGTTEGYTGSINQYGASFGKSSRGDDAKASITYMILTTEVSDPIAFAEEEIGSAIVSLNEVEVQMSQALPTVAALREQIKSNITVI